MAAAVVEGDRSLARGWLRQQLAQAGRKEDLPGCVAFAALLQLAGGDRHSGGLLLCQTLHLAGRPAAAVAPQHQRVTLCRRSFRGPANEIQQRFRRA